MSTHPNGADDRIESGDAGRSRRHPAGRPSHFVLWQPVPRVGLNGVSLMDGGKDQCGARKVPDGSDSARWIAASIPLGAHDNPNLDGHLVPGGNRSARAEAVSARERLGSAQRELGTRFVRVRTR
jgi:hypothetical protein